MSSLNRTVYRQNVTAPQYNHNGLKVAAISNESQLVRMTMAHMLWENQFYVNGQESAKIMSDLVSKVDPVFVQNLAVAAREKFKLRHVPLHLMRGLAKTGKLKAEALADVIQRPDEMSEFLAMYWADKKEPISNQVKKGLALAFGKFNEYQLSKWDKNSAEISLRDVMFLAHPKPRDEAQALLFKKVADKSLATADTWETELSGGADKAETFERLMSEGKLGALAFLRNLRNMDESGIDSSAIRAYGAKVNVDRVLPFRFISAARIMPKYEDMLEQMMFRATAGMEKLPGKTLLLVDCSGSMFDAKVSAKSDLLRFDAAMALAILCREVCEEVEIFGFCDDSFRVAPRRGFALIDAMHEAAWANYGGKLSKHYRYNQDHARSHGYGGTNMGASVLTANKLVGKYDRIISFTDEQSSTKPTKRPDAKGYILNVAAYQNGLNLDSWTTISGFSEASLEYIQMFEREGV